MSSLAEGYEEYIRRKSDVTLPSGLSEHGALSDALFDYQRDLVTWALRRGRAALFADTGLGKTLMQLEWARHVSEQVGPVLVLTPLAVAEQTVREGARFGIEATLSRDGTVYPITVTNYEMLDRFDAGAFAGVVLDESSILKAYDGKTRTAIIETFAATRFKLACTATPAPNDHTELGNHAEFLGIKTRVEMLAEYFCHDGGNTQVWRLKGHAEDVFWKWVCTWAAVLRSPADLGYDGSSHVLPELRMHEHVISIDHTDAWSEGYLFAPDARTLSEQRATRRATMAQRVSVAAELADGDEPVVIWCELNAEGDALEKAIPGAVQVQGSDDVETKRDRLLGFASSKYRVLITKPSIAGFGMNWQHCARMIFVGASHSYEQTYQAIRRCWRFGQTRPVDVHVIRAETEGAITANFNRKAEDHREMVDGMVAQMRTIQRAEMQGIRREWNEYEPRLEMVVPEWVGMEAA